MHRTLFTPAMLETFRSCPRAYEVAFLKYTKGTGGNVKPNILMKKFILRALAEINRRRVCTVNQVQKYIGQNWPLSKNDEMIDKEMGTRAFLFAYKCLTRYVLKPYVPEGAEVVAVALKVRARIAHVRVYVEDTLDLVLWYPQEKRLELVDFQFKALKPFDPTWPSPSLLVRYYLGERLKTRWPFEKLSLTQLSVSTHEFQANTANLDESIFRIHWPELVKTLEEMKELESKDVLPCAAHGQEVCQQCTALIQANDAEKTDSNIIRLTA